MARQPRDDAPGVAHHVMIRGIERRAIFVDDTDREDFLVRLARLALELGFLVFAWVLMPNHVHLVVRSAHAHISRLMSRLGTGYARRFNERHERVGHLFENRFRSRRVMDDADLLGLVLYVTRNPKTLALFDADPRRARQRIRDRLGSFETGRFADPPPRQPVPSAAQAPSSFEDLLREVSSRHALSPETFRSRARTAAIAAARRELAIRAAADLGLSGSEIGRRLGLTPSAVSKMLASVRHPRLFNVSKNVPASGG